MLAFQKSEMTKEKQSLSSLYLKLSWSNFHTMKWAHSVNLAARHQIFGIALITPENTE